jgi:hypothetical protein
MPNPIENQPSATREPVATTTVSQSNSEQVAPTGERQVFRALRRQLSDEDLTNPGVQKLILHMLEQAESDRDEAEGFRQRFHDSDKEVAVLEEKGKTVKAVDIAYGVGTGLGGVMMGAAFYFWGKSPPENLSGGIIFCFGLVLFIGGVLIKVIKAK